MCCYDREPQLAMAAGMGRVDPATQYLMLHIDMELAVPNDRSSLRGVGARLGIEEICRRAELHPEETAASWDARFRMHRKGWKRLIPQDPLVQIVVHVNMMERQADPLLFHTSRFMSAVCHTRIHDPYAPPTGTNMALQGEEAGRAGYWWVAGQTLDSIVEAYKPPVPA